MLSLKHEGKKMFFTKTRNVLLLRYVCTARGLQRSGSLGELLPLEPRPGRLNCKRQFLQPQHKSLRALAASQVLPCVREHVPGGSSGLVTAEIYACGYRQKERAFLYLQRNGRKLQNSVTGSELWTVIPSCPSATFWLQLCPHCRH